MKPKKIALLMMAAMAASCMYGQTISVSLKVFLEGPYIGGQMNTFLNISNYLPLTQPYNTAPWNYPGTESVAAIPNANVVDWVLVQLRETAGDASTAYEDNIIATQAGFVLKNGSIVTLDGTSPMQFTVTVSYKLYAVVYHRNHLPVLSGGQLILNAGVYTWDFTSGAGQAYGGVNAHKQVGAGIWGMISGDGNADGQINNNDKNDVWKPEAGLSGYKPGDFSMNGQVDNVDKNDLWKANSGKSSQVVRAWSCGKVFTDMRDGQIYPTVQIGTQCWMAENLNIGTMIQGMSTQTNNGTIEKYCYDNAAANCDVYGGLYQWDEMMQYATTPGVKGICPDGWHLPPDGEFCTLTQYVDPTVICGASGWSGTDAGTKMKSASGWFGGGNGTNTSGFTALPAGIRYPGEVPFMYLTWVGQFWSSGNSFDAAWSRDLYFTNADIERLRFTKDFGLSVRCVKGDTPPAWSCGDPFTDPRDNQEYTTVLIGTQCWMAENLNVGTMIQGANNQTNNGIIEKYCYDNSTANCDVYGGLYQWDELMEYVTTPGVRGICPDGWHIPTDDEWCSLEQFVDPIIICSESGWRGVDGGGKLKEEGTIHWMSPNTGATNSSGFTALPGGGMMGGSFLDNTEIAHFLSSSEAINLSYAVQRVLAYLGAPIFRGGSLKSNGNSSRCLRN